MAGQYPAPTNKFHIVSYPSIDPKRPELSVKGKTIVITGAGVGIGRATAEEFALAGPKDIHIIGRTKTTLEETKSIIAKKARNVEVTIHIADVADETAIQKAAKAIGPWDIFVHNAGYLSKRNKVMEADTKEWWQSFETNVKGSFIVTKYFLPNRKAEASLVALSTAVVSIPPSMIEGTSAYTASKFATIKFFEFVAAETPGLQVITMHPGVIQTAMAAKSEMEIPQFDDIKLSAHFIIWAASKEAAFANGRFLWSNWDVDELKENSKFKEDPFYCTSNILPWPKF